MTDEPRSPKASFQGRDRKVGGLANRPIVALTRSHIVEFLREPGAVFWVFGFPVLMAVVLGLAFRSRPSEQTPIAVMEDGSAAAWALESLTQSPAIDPRLLPPGQAEQALRKGDVELVVEASRNGEDPDSGPTFGPEADNLYTVTYRFDPTRPTSHAARLLVDDALQRAAGRKDPVSTRQEEWTEPGSRYIDFLMPGLIGLNVMSSSLFGMGFAVVLMRTRKLLKRFAATPMRRSDFLLSFMLSRLIFLAVEVAFLVAFGWLAFDVAVRGSLLDLAVISLLGSLSFTGIALLIAARPRSIEVASGWMNLVMIPMWLCCGSFFSYSRFPEVLHPVIRALPLTAFNDAARAIINDGAPLTALASELVVTVVWGVFTFVLALRIFRWQ